MKLGINILFLEPGKVGGTETATCQILAEIDKNFALKNKVIVYSNQNFANKYKFKNIQVKSLIKNSQNKSARLSYELFILPIKLYQDRIDLLHSMGYTSPIITHCKKIVTIYDLQFKYYPQTVPFVVRLVYSFLIPLVAFSNRIIITSSKSSKKQIKENYPLLTRNKKIKIVPLGSGLTKASKRKVKKQNYIFTPAASHPHKNLIRLIEAFSLLKKELNFKETELFISGSPGKQEKEFKKIIQRQDVQKDIKFLGWLSNEKYIQTIRRAKICIIPSLYEGFGLPVLEAFTSQTPLIVSDKTSLPEIAGKAAIYCDPLDTEDIYKKMKNLLKNKKLQDKLIAKGNQQLKKFSWEKTGKETVSVYKQVKKK